MKCFEKKSSKGKLLYKKIKIRVLSGIITFSKFRGAQNIYKEDKAQILICVK